MHSKPTSSEELPANKKNSYFEKTKQEFGFKVAYIVFSTQFSMSKSLKEPLSEPQILSTQDKPIHTGLRSKIDFSICILLVEITPDYLFKKKRMDWKLSKPVY